MNGYPEHAPPPWKLRRAPNIALLCTLIIHFAWPLASASATEIECKGKNGLRVEKEEYCDMVLQYQPLDIAHDKRINDAIPHNNGDIIRNIADHNSNKRI